MGLDIRVRRRSFQSPCSHANASLRMEHHRHYCCINLRPLGADVCPATQKENLVMEPDEIDLDDDLTADYDSSLDYQTDEKAYPASTKINANMHWAAALLFGTWYSIILGSAMSAGFKYLHPDTPYGCRYRRCQPPIHVASTRSRSVCLAPFCIGLGSLVVHAPR